jgi:integrase
MVSFLTDAAIRSAKTKDKPYKLSDGGGLFLLVSPSKKNGGSKWWRFKYRFEGREKLLSFGSYPEISLLSAREKRDAARKLVAEGIDPSQERKAAKAAESGAGTFEAVAREWHSKFSPGWAESHSVKLLRRLELYIFPWIGSRPVSKIEAHEVLSSIQRIEAKGNLETARRALQVCGQVLRYAVQTQRAERNCVADLVGAIPAPSQKHMASITDPVQVGHLLRAIQNYPGSFVTRCALQLAPIFFLRPGELRKAEWSEVDLDRAEWRIPIERMKRSQKEKNSRQGEVAHVVPLSRQALVILHDLYQLTGNGRYLFPGLRSKDRPMSDATLINALRRMGYTGDEMTVHGFRHMASTLLHEHGYPSHLIEKQLSHSDRNRVRAVYNYAEYLSERKKMMQDWADYLDKLKAG